MKVDVTTSQVFNSGSGSSNDRPAKRLRLQTHLQTKEPPIWLLQSSSMALEFLCILSGRRSSRRYLLMAKFKQPEKFAKWVDEIDEEQQEALLGLEGAIPTGD
ncbi:hypothetical protein WJX77_005131 [Trebouxia sp. C0004]